MRIPTVLAAVLLAATAVLASAGSAAADYGFESSTDISVSPNGVSYAGYDGSAAGPDDLFGS
ncbi:hypothetical protein [Kitasatospora brasiliensis]|uniref:hypothetical protein n=1 Tax=Kitasatospora brasiliensis TaxID=3058040 RepID=UPI0029304189|nr:hypothetical protein [Kitasatospora sp. K002]